MNQNLFFRLTLSFLLANLTVSKPIKESKEVLEIRAIIKAFVDQLAHADILKPKEEPKVTTTTKTRRTKQKSSKQKSSHYRFFQDRKYLFKKWSIVSLKMYKSISNFFFRKLLKELSSVKSTFCHTFSEML